MRHSVAEWSDKRGKKRFATTEGPGIVWPGFVHAKRGAIMSRVLLCGAVAWLVTG